MTIPVSQTYIDMIKAFRADCDMLIGQFKNANYSETNMFETFLQLWKSLNFVAVYGKKYSKHGMEHDFKHDTLQIAKLIMLRDHFPGGMFLMYGLYCLQDYPMAKIRLELDEFTYIRNTLRSEEEGSTMKNHQLAWIYSKLLAENAFDFVVFGREYDIEGLHRAEMIYNKRYDFSDDENPKKTQPQEELENFIKSLPKEVNDLEDEVFKMKLDIKEAFPSLNLSLTTLDEDINTTLRSSLTALTALGSVVDDGDAADSKIGEKRRLLKKRTKKIKHRYETEDTEEETAQTEVPKKTKGKKSKSKNPKKYFVSKDINDPSPDSSSDNGDDLVSDNKTPKSQLSLPNLN